MTASTDWIRTPPTTEYRVWPTACKETSKTFDARIASWRLPLLANFNRRRMTTAEYRNGSCSPCKAWNSLEGVYCHISRVGGRGMDNDVEEHAVLWKHRKRRLWNISAKVSSSDPSLISSPTNASRCLAYRCCSLLHASAFDFPLAPRPTTLGGTVSPSTTMRLDKFTCRSR